MAITLLLIFLIVALMLRSPVAGIVVVGTSRCRMRPHWRWSRSRSSRWWLSGPTTICCWPCEFAKRPRAGLGAGIIRAFAATGGVVTTAGIVFGITMFALAASTVLSVAQIGVTVGVGLLIDTLVMRSFVLPSIVALLGRWFWWSTRIATKVPS
jgi:putative drug exporter of the RND superfamily